MVTNVRAATVLSIFAAASDVTRRGALGEVEIGEVLDLICEADDDLGTLTNVAGPCSHRQRMIRPPRTQLQDGEVMLQQRDELGECAVFDEYREDMTEMLHGTKNVSCGQLWPRERVGGRLFKHYRIGAKESKLSIEKFVSRLCNKMSKACPAKCLACSRWSVAKDGTV
eukprot:Skav222470  [mRNA]  locus=scaffold242:4129:6421:+ [translate_table: standard]